MLFRPYVFSTDTFIIYVRTNLPPLFCHLQILSDKQETQKIGIFSLSLAISSKRSCLSAHTFAFSHTFHIFNSCKHYRRLVWTLLMYVFFEIIMIFSFESILLILYLLTWYEYLCIVEIGYRYFSA